MVKKLLLFIVFLILSKGGFSIKTDSLRIEFISTTNVNSRLDIAYNLAKKTLFSVPDTAAKYLFIAVKDSSLAPKSRNLANCFNAIGIYYFNNSNFDSTIYYSSRALSIFLSLHDTSKSIPPRKNLALARRSMGKYNEALDEFFKILDFYKNTKKQFKIAATLNDIGNTYSYLGDNNQAIKYQFEALSYLKSTENNRLEGNIYNSLGYIFSSIGKVDSAILYYEKSLQLKLQSGNVYSIIVTRNNICTLIDYKKHPNKCENCLLKLLEDQRTVNDIQGLARTFLNLSVQYSYYKQCKKAINKLDSTEYYLTFTDDIFLKQHFFQLYAKILFQCEKYTLAYAYQDSLLALNDSIYRFQKRQEIFELDTKYQTQQKIENIKILEAKNVVSQLKVQNQRWQILFLVLLLVSIVGASIFTLSYVKQKQKKLKEMALIKMREAERVRIARDMHDEIGSGLTRISLISEQLRLQPDIDKSESGISKIINQSRLLTNNLREIIWAIDPKNDELPEMLFYFRDYINDFFSSTNIDFSIVFPDDIPNIEITSQVRRNIFLALKEMLNNIAKHANATNVSVSFIINDSVGFLTVKDNGCGFDVELVKKGVGLGSLQERAKTIGGIFSIESKIEVGTVVEIKQIPLFTTKV